VGSKERLDKLVTHRRLIRSRARAQRMIMAGRIRVNGQTVYRPGHMVDIEAAIEVVAPEPFVSRGGEKLEGALDGFRLDPTGKVCLDIGSATGGFTDCLLQHGAERVHCVDVGKGQLDWRLRNNSRVVVHEGLNARYLTCEDIGEPIDLVTIDVSFISLRLILPPLCALVGERGDLVTLVKPQFEAGREKVGKGGVVRDQAVHLQVLKDLRAFVDEVTPWAVVATMFSPLVGPAGNIEFFFHLRRDEGSSTSKHTHTDYSTVVAEAHASLLDKAESTNA